MSWNLEQVRQQLPNMYRIDLMNFDDGRLSEEGELEVSKHFKHNIMLELGKDLVELSTASLPESSNMPAVGNTTNAYILRNLSDPTGQGSLLFGDEVQHVGEMPYRSNTLMVLGRSTITLGRSRDASPDLNLSQGVSRRHMQIRLGNMAGNLHFADLYSTNGTRVYLDREDTWAVGTPRRAWLPFPGRSLAGQRGRWER